MGNATSRSIKSALEEVTSWEVDTKATNARELSEVDQEVERLNAAVANLKQQLEALDKFRGELVEKGENIGNEVLEKSHEALFEALGSQVEVIAQRGTDVRAAEDARAAVIGAKVNEPELAELMNEYKQFKETVEPTLEALPESYRGVIVQHHETVTEKLRDQVLSLAEGEVEVEGDDIEIDVAYAVDAPDGKPELLTMVVPVPDESYTEWAKHGETLGLRVASRAVQGLYAAALKSGLPGAHAVCGGHRDMLAVELDVMGAKADFAETLGAELKAAFDGATELSAAKVKINPVKVDIDHLLGPEEPLEEGAEEEVSNA